MADNNTCSIFCLTSAIGNFINLVEFLECALNDDISLKFNISKEEVALLFVNAITEIDKIVIGIEKIEQLKRNVKIANNFKNINKIKSIINFKDFVIEDENMIDPRKWV